MLRRVLAGASLVAAAATLVLGLLVVFGWYTHNATLVQVLPSFVPMQYNTALGFILCGAGLMLLALHRERGAAVAGYAAALIGGLTLVEYIGRVNLGIDELFMKHDITVATSHPGRMAPNTAICFFLVGLALAFRPAAWSPPRRSLVRVILGSLAFGLGVVALSGYFARLETAYGWGNLTRMAVHTSAGFIVVSTGLLCLVWSRDIRSTAWLPRWTPIPLAISILTATLSFWQALAAENARLPQQLRDLTSLSHLATLVLLGGGLLAAAMALVAWLAQKAGQRAREVATANLALQEEVETRQRAERTLEEHLDNLERLVGERTRDLDQARHEAEAANQAKSEFLSNMSHELRTPLNGVLGYAQILQGDPEIGTEQRRTLGSIESCGQHLLTLINDILDLSKIEAGRLEIHRAPCDLPRLLESVADIVRPRADEKGLGFDFQAAPDLPRGILTDATKLRQVLVNLLGNAIKFTDEGSVTLSARISSGQLELGVEDTGIGMTAEELESVFDPFKQAEGGRVAGGTGLGLPISRRLTEALGGRLEAESQEGRGSRFTVLHPVEEVAVAELEAADSRPFTRGRHLVLATGQESSVLVVDDHPENRDVLVRLLQTAGFHTLEATTGREALERLRAEKPPLVLMDIRMPEMDGFEATRAIRDDPTLSDTVVIAVSASVFENFREKALGAGFDDFIRKPIQVAEVFDRIAAHLDVAYVEQGAGVEDAKSDETAAEESLPPELARKTAARLRDACELGDVDALEALAEELRSHMAPAEADRIAELARSVDFDGILRLAASLEQTG